MVKKNKKSEDDEEINQEYLEIEDARAGFRIVLHSRKFPMNKLLSYALQTRELCLNTSKRDGVGVG